VWAQNLGGLFARNRRADQVEEHAAGRPAAAAIGQQQAPGALGLQRLVKERLRPVRSQDAYGALDLFAGAGLGFPEMGGDLVDGAGRVFR